MKKPEAEYVEQVSRGARLLEGKWTVHILCAIRDHPMRLSSLTRAIPEASKKALTASLRTLESEGIVRRRDLSNTVLRVEYEVNERVRPRLARLLDCLSDWAQSSDAVNSFKADS